MGVHLPARQGARALAGGLGSDEPERISRDSTANLSTTASWWHSETVARAGVEPATFRFSGGRSYQLSYLARRREGGPHGATETIS
jgi:hypothetical protein